MKNHIAKGIAGIALAGAGYFGASSLDSTQIQSLETDIATTTQALVAAESDKAMLIAAVDSEKAVKEDATDAYVYAMISSGRKPAIDVVPLNDLEASYIRAVGTTTIDDKDLFKVGVDLAQDRGDFICNK